MIGKCSSNANRENQLASEIIKRIRTELIGLFPAVDRAILCLEPVFDHEELNGLFAVEGREIHCSQKMTDYYRISPAFVRRAYLHSVIHCLFLHQIVDPEISGEAWDLHCDDIVERILASLREPRLKVCDELLSECHDDHRYWGCRSVSEEEIELWQGLREEALSGGFGAGAGQEAGGTPGTGVEELREYNGRLFRYRQYLRKFMSPGEETELDPENFDPIYYHLGMTEYDGMPFIEPLETREVFRLDELVIAIDTSGSCSAELVSRFFRETDAILTERGNFFTTMHVLLLQCDCWINHAAEIHSKDEWKSYLENIRIYGRGGTDYNPVFREIDIRRREGKMKRPKALICFTDGDGSYPEKAPDYEVIFVLAGEKKKPDAVPKWIRVLEL